MLKKEKENKYEKKNKYNAFRKIYIV